MARLHTYIRPHKLAFITLMPGHNGLFAHQLPIALSYFTYVDIPGFSRRRSHLFAIIQFAFAIVLEDLLHLSCLSLSQSQDRNQFHGEA
jgi:hypothetical protein